MPSFVYRLPEVVDACLAGLSVAAVIALIHAADDLITGVKLFHPSMLPACAMVCNNAVVPSPRAFCVTSACAVVAGVVFHTLGATGTTNPAIISALHLFFSKMAGASFGPTVALAGFLSGTWTSWKAPIEFIVAPWLTGYAMLYLFAATAASGRRRVRVALELRTVESALGGAVAGLGDSEEAIRARLRKTFEKYDTNRDGTLDKLEFRVAYRALTGSDISEADCADVIRAVDTSGDEVVDFDEWVAAIEPFIPRGAAKHKRN